MEHPKPPRLSAVVPCYNEASGLNELYNRLSRACQEVVSDDYEVVLVDDGSADSTWDRLRDLSTRDPHVIAVRLSRNHGHQLALTAGLSLCRGDLVLIIDADLQDPPELLGQMVELINQGADVVFGQRISRAGEGWTKRATASLFYRFLSTLSDVPIPRDTGDFRLMTRRAVEVLQSMPEQHRFIRGMVSWIGYRQVPIRYEREKRFAGSTKYPFHKMMRLAIDAITGFSTRPLRLSLYLSFIAGMLAAILFAYAFASWLFLDAVHGWTSLMAVVLLLGCAQMLMLGIIGEYLGRLYAESKRRPLFVIADVVRAETVAAETAESRGLPGPATAGSRR